MGDVPAENVLVRVEGEVPVKGAKLNPVLDVPGVRSGRRSREPMRNVVVHVRIQNRLVLSNPGCGCAKERGAICPGS
jgi:hypothetical protein